jgi:hypothetical protein
VSDLALEKIFFLKAEVEAEHPLVGDTIARVLGLLVPLHFTYLHYMLERG